MLKNPPKFGLAIVSAIMATQAYAVENEAVMQFSGQPTNQSLYTSSEGLGTMEVNPPGVGGLALYNYHSAVFV
jgi:hypothetical protein